MPSSAPDVAAAPDSGLDAESGYDLGEEEPDIGASDAAAPQDMSPVMISPPHPERWLAERPCTALGRTVERVSDDPFEVRTTPEFLTKRTRAFYESVLESPLRTVFIQIQADSKYGVENNLQYDIYVNPGDDLVFRMHFSQPKFDDRYVVTPMLDYEPVEVKFERYSSDREELLQEVTDTGYLFDTVDRLDPVDMTIPTEAFTPGRMHEVAVAMRGRVGSVGAFSRPSSSSGEERSGWTQSSGSSASWAIASERSSTMFSGCSG